MRIFPGRPRCSCHSQRHAGRSVAVSPYQQRQTTCTCSFSDFHELTSLASRSTLVLGRAATMINIPTVLWRRRQSFMMDHSQARLVACWARHVRPGGFGDHLTAPVPLLIHEQGCFERQQDACQPCSSQQAGSVVLKMPRVPCHGRISRRWVTSRRRGPQCHELSRGITQACERLPTACRPITHCPSPLITAVQ